MFHKLFIISFLTCITFNGSAQYRSSLQDYYLKKVIGSRRFARRISLGVGKHFLSGTAQFTYHGWDTLEKKIIDKELEQNIKVVRNWTIYLGSFFPIAPVSDNSMLVFNTELMASIASLTYDSLRFQGTKGYAASTTAFKGGGLFSIEYRLGGDIPLNKSEAGMFTIGGGLNPCIVNSNDYNKIPPFKIIPFVKAELGFFAGMAVKLRGIYYFGSSRYADDVAIGISDTGVGDKLTTKMSGSNGFDLALVIMPFSVNWNSDDW